MKLYVLRHGESQDDVEDRYGGFANYPLTLKGKQSAKELAEKLKDSGIEMLFTSPYTRAHDTAKEIAEELGIPLEIDIDIRERNTYGYLSGMRKTMGAEMFPKDHERVKDPAEADKIDGSEKVEEVKERVSRFIEKIKEFDYPVVGMVTHGKAIGVLLKEILMIEEKIKPKDCGYVVVDLDKGKVVDKHNVEGG